MELSRRKALAGLGTAGVGGVLGMSAFTGSAAAKIRTNFTAANPGTVSTDDGEVSEVFVAPKVYTQWENFDEAPKKLRYILHAGIEGEGYNPVYRETPFLMDENGDPTHGTTDRVPGSGKNHLLTRNSDFYELNSNGQPKSTPKIVLYKDGLSDYYNDPSDYPDEAHWTGASLGSDSGDYANGNYGVIANTGAFDSPTDGETASTAVNLRLITVLLNEDSETVMQDEYPVYEAGNYTYSWLKNNADSHPAISVNEASFTVTAQNEQSDSASGGNANPGAN